MSKKDISETARVIISAHITEILMLYGRLHKHYNARYLPVTVSSIIGIILELEQISKELHDFDAVLTENIERRQKYSQAFKIPTLVHKMPTLGGLCLAMYDLANPLVLEYCTEEKKFLAEGLSVSLSKNTRCALLVRSVKYCNLLLTFNTDHRVQLEDLKSWCTLEMKRYS